jgi:23S rRNA pseudouridine1911/1915/1917 synthase
MEQFTITKQNSGQRLDKFLTPSWPEYSRAYLQKQIKAGAVLVNGKLKKPGYVLKEADKIAAEISPPPEISLEPDASVKFGIVYEDDDVIVIDKPACLTVHPSVTQKNDTLVNALISRYPPLKNVGDDALRPGLVHRLDKDTSGLMIIAKNNKAFAFLKKQFQERKVEKKYLALVVDKPKEPTGEIKTFITRSKSDPTKQKVIKYKKASGALSAKTPDAFSSHREAITNYKTLREFKNFTLIEALPKTGRMHQIRVHLAWLGIPVAGDKKYGRKNQTSPPGLKRQFLHASKLKIKLPDGQKKEFSSLLPPDLSRVLTALETKRGLC